MDVILYQEKIKVC